MSAAIRLHYLQCLFGQTIHVLDSMPAGAAAGTIITAANTLQLGISEKLGTFMESAGTIIASIIVAFVKSWSLTLVTGTVIVFILLAVGILLPFIVKGQERQTSAETKSSSIANEVFGSIRMVAACGAEKQLSERFGMWANVAEKHGQKTAPVMSLQFGLVFFALYGSFGLAFWYGTKSVTDGRVSSVGDIVVVLMSIMMMVISSSAFRCP
jgi:ATP-binding cassette, subfamily B (MDR/TAP), member 1